MNHVLDLARWTCLALALAAAGAVARADAGVTAAVSHLTDVTVAEIGRTRVIAFRVGAPAPEDREFASVTGDAARLEVVRTASVLAGETIGYVRVRGLRAGETDLDVAGETLRVRVIAPRTNDPARFAPEIIGPAPGAVVWGTISVGVLLREPADDGGLRDVTLRGSDGSVLHPVADSRLETRPLRQLRFEIDTDAQPPGPLELTAVATDDAGVEQAGTPVRVRVERIPEARLTAGEAEAPYDVDRPQRFSDGRLQIGRHRDASGGAYFSNAASNPAVCFPITVERPGLYQVMLVAGGTRAQGALPTVGLVVDGANQSATNARLLDEGWHRLALGVPIRLEAGERVLTPYFANDFYVANRVDRNLMLDRIEVARVADAATDAGPDAGAMMMMVMAGAAGAGAGDEGGGADDHFAEKPAGLRIGLVRPLDGQVLPGLFEIEARAWWESPETAPAPVVSLFVNDVLIAEQRSGAPRFWVDPSCFVAGENRIALVARLDSGAVARTPVQTMSWPAAPDPALAAPARRHHRYSIHEDAWEPGIKERLENRHYPKERRALILSSEGEVALTLPDGLAGSFDVFLEAMGEHFEGAPIASVRLAVGADEPVDVGAIEIPRGWGTRRVATADLEPGPKKLLVGFTNDRFEAGRGDRNLCLQAVLLVEKPRGEDRTAPTVTVTYPKDDGQRMAVVDAIVVEVSDDASLAAAEVLLDGMSTGMSVRSCSGTWSKARTSLRSA